MAKRMYNLHRGEDALEVARLKAENTKLKEELQTMTAERDKYRNDWVCADDDANYYHAIFDGSWPQSVEILESALKRVLTLRE